MENSANMGNISWLTLFHSSLVQIHIRASSPLVQNSESFHKTSFCKLGVKSTLTEQHFDYV